MATSYASDPAPVRWGLRIVTVGYVFLLVAWPTALVFKNALANGFGAMFETFSDPEIAHAISLTLTITVWAVAINLVFGLTISILLVRYDFPGKRALSAMLDVPLAVSPVVVGLALILVYGSYAPAGGWLARHGLQVIFSLPGMVLATVFVSLPLVVRAVVPVLRELGQDQEEAAHTLGATGWQTFVRITLPGIRAALGYGVVLCLARALGEYGAVAVVSGRLVGQTQTATLFVEERYQNFDQTASYAVATVLALIAVLILLLTRVLRGRDG